MKFTGQFQKKPAASSAPIPFSTGRFRSRSFPMPEAQRSPSTNSNTANSELLQRRQPDYNQIFGVQPKLTVGAPNDHYEQEADRVADQVMSMPDKPIQRMDNLEEEEIQTKPLAGSITPLVQRMDNLEEEDIQTKASENADIQREDNLEEEEIQTKPLGSIQREDNLEEEEIQTKAIDGSIQREDNLEEEDLQMKSSGSIQREDNLEEEEIQTKPALQRLPDGSLQAGSSIESRLNGSKGGGSPLPDDVRSFMEPRFGTDFSQVRVHTGSEAVQMNRDLNAQAFTHQQDVYFGAGKSAGKDALTAHELTHVVQQNEGLVRRSALPKQLQNHSTSKTLLALNPFQNQSVSMQDTSIQRTTNQGKQGSTDDAAQQQREQFKANYTKFVKNFKLASDKSDTEIEQDADIILNELLKGLESGESDLASTPKIDDQQRKDYRRNAIASETEQEESVDERDVMATSKTRGGADVYTNDLRPKRNEAFAKAQQSLDVFAAHAGANLTNAIFQKVDQAGGNKVSLCFWSGVGSMNAAKNNNPDGIVLESTIGSWFDDINLKDLTGSSLYRIDLWATLSEIYAKKAAEYQEYLDLKGYVGIDADMTQNIFNQIESPTVTQIGTAKFNTQAKITWHVVESSLDAAQNTWKPTGRILHASNREAAVEMVRAASKAGHF